MKTGIGSYAIEIGELQIGAVVILNALGDVYDWKNGKKVAGLLNDDNTSFRDTLEFMSQSIAVVDNKFAGNTTIGIIITNAAFNKSELCKIAGMAHDGFARSIKLPCITRYLWNIVPTRRDVLRDTFNLVHPSAQIRPLLLCHLR